MLKDYLPYLIVLLCLTAAMPSQAAQLKPRMVVLTDISPDNVEPDDMESMIRLLVHADMYEIEALVHSTGWSVWGNAGDTGLNLIREAIDLYEKDLPNIMKRSNQHGHAQDNEPQEIGYWPSADYLRSRTMLGSKNRGQKYIGKDNNSDGSQTIIDLAAEDDDRPIWVTVWGGGNTLAQACWQVQQAQTPEQLKAFLKKIRVYAITDQDGAQKSGNVIHWPESSHQWMRKAFEKDLFFIWDESAWGYQNGTGRSRWNDYQTHIQGHGNLGHRYPKYKYGVEGDTPAFLHLMPTGLNNPDVPDQVGWGGYFEFGQCRDNATHAYQNHKGRVRNTSSRYQTYFYQATFNNFAARMDWAKEGTGNRNPIVVINDDKSIHILTKKPQEGTKVLLDASKTYDLDEDELTFRWWVLSEAGSYSKDVNISNSESSIATIDVPSDSAGKSFHVICEVTDDGTHHLSSYRRIIFEPSPSDAMTMLQAGTRPRVIATTDGEVDDRSSMIRFLLYTCDFDVAGIVQVNSRYQKSGHSDKKWIEAQLDTYEKLLPQLRKHNSDYPDASQLRSVMRVGNENREDLYVAPPEMETKNTSGAQLIIDTLLDNDPRPVHVLSWGGANTTASALWKLKTEYPKERFEYAASRIRIYCIWYQDGGGQWIQENIPQAHINEAYRWDNVWDYESYDHARKKGKMSANPPFVQAYMKPAWLNENVKRGHGPLGAMTPQTYISEGDTPSFLHLVNNGLDAHLDYTLGGWGGRSAYDNPTYPNHITDKALKDDGNPNKMYWRWVPAAQNDFAARMDWCVKGFKKANHAPVVKVKGSLNRDVKAGGNIELSATATDPDNNELTTRWWQYADADSTTANVTIANSDSLDTASFMVPNEPGKQVHIILEVTDNGTPALVGYQRIIYNIK